jgi:hypothetical protein
MGVLTCASRKYTANFQVTVDHTLKVKIQFCDICIAIPWKGNHDTQTTPYWI